MTQALKLYSVTELELSSIVHAFINAKHWLIGSPRICVFKNHSPLKNIFDKDLDDIDDPRIVVLFKKIICYKYTVSTIPGNFNQVVEFLSRFPCRHTHMPEIERNLPTGGS